MRIFFASCVVAILCWILAAVFICFRGLCMPYEQADIAVVLGNALDKHGAPRPILAARLNVALQCYRERRCPVLFVSGSIDGPNLNEALSMRAWLIDRGVPERDIVVDDQGDNTLASARNATAYMRAHGMTRVMLITQYYHLARARLAFERAGAPFVAGAFPHRFRAMDFYSTWREVPAYVVYWLRLTLDADARPVSFRPVRYLMEWFSGAK
jgi:vancomycin permeability regulator SanA